MVMMIDDVSYHLSFPPQLLGVIILDLHARRPKSHTPACYVIQAGRTQRRPRSRKNDSTLGNSDSPKIEMEEEEVYAYQTPVVALLMSVGEDLSFEHFSVLFHEFGHALHHVFAKSQFQHHSGIRAEVECAETPSTLMEVRFFFLSQYFCLFLHFLPMIVFVFPVKFIEGHLELL